MKYTSAQVEALTLGAVARSKREWVPEKDGTAPSIQSVQEEFSCAIKPQVGELVIEPHIAVRLGVPEGRHKVWFLLNTIPQRVFFDERSATFGCGWGPDGVSDEYVDLGFRTNDPIDAYLA